MARVGPGAGQTALAAVLVTGVAVAFGAPGAGARFVSDDWGVVLRASDASGAELVRGFASLRSGWYRPLWDILAAGCLRWFGPTAWAWHAASLALHGASAALVVLLGRAVSGDLRVAALAGAVFATAAAHAEPVLWIAAASEPLAGLFALVAVLAYVAHRRTGRTAPLVVTIVATLAALAAKETALAVPVVLAAVDMVIGDAPPGGGLGTRAGRPASGARRAWRDRRALARAGAWLAVALTFAAFRLRAGPPAYPVDWSAAQLARNLVYDLLMLLAALPDATSHLARGAPGATIARGIVALSGASLLFVTAGWASSVRTAPRARRGPGGTPSGARGRPPGADRALWLGMAWTGAGLLPVLPIVAERTLYMASIGASLALAALFVAAWDRAPAGRRRAALALAVGVFLAAQAAGQAQRVRWWALAGRESAAVFDALAAWDARAPAGRPVRVVGLPDRIGTAYAFHNALPDAGRVLGFAREVTAVPAAAEGAARAAPGGARPAIGETRLRYVERGRRGAGSALVVEHP